jgi:hypothetical protein
MQNAAIAELHGNQCLRSPSDDNERLRARRRDPSRSCVRSRPEVTMAANASTSMPLEKLSPCPNRTAARSDEPWSFGDTPWRARRMFRDRFDCGCRFAVFDELKQLNRSGGRSCQRAKDRGPRRENQLLEGTQGTSLSLHHGIRMLASRARCFAE